MYRVSGIFSITNNLTGKQYIGQSIDIYALWKKYKYNYNTGNSEIFSDMRTFGIENFSFKIIEKCPIYLLNDKEKYYIQLYNTISPNGYNKTTGGRGWRY